MDERAAFEAWLKKEYGREANPIETRDFHRSEGWSARAALDRSAALEAALRDARKMAEDFSETCDRWRKDAERYRWLRADVPPQSSRWSRWEVRYWGGNGWETMTGTALDDAIDEIRGGRRG